MSEKTHHELVNLLKEWSQAIVSNDAGAIGQFMSDDWVIIGETGVTERNSFLGLVESGELTHETMEHHQARVQVYGDVAVVITRGMNNGTFKGEPFSSDEWITDVFTKKNGRWVCELTHLTPAHAC